MTYIPILILLGVLLPGIGGIETPILSNLSGPNSWKGR